MICSLFLTTWLFWAHVLNLLKLKSYANIHVWDCNKGSLRYLNILPSNWRLINKKTIQKMRIKFFKKLNFCCFKVACLHNFQVSLNLDRDVFLVTKYLLRLKRHISWREPSVIFWKYVLLPKYGQFWPWPPHLWPGKNTQKYLISLYM